MTEKLSIRNFVGILELDLELRQINILIGPQATGKSVCAKLFYFFKSFINELYSAIERDTSKKEYNAHIRDKFYDYFPPESWGESIFFIRYEINDMYIEVERSDEKKSKIKIKYSDYFWKEVLYFRAKLKRLIEKYDESDDDRDEYEANFKIRRLFYKKITEDIKQPIGFSQLFIPAGRSFFANLQSSVFSFLSSNASIDPFLKEFGSFYENVKTYSYRRLRSRLKNKSFITTIDNMAEDILGGKHLREKEKDFLILPDGRKINVENSSSGQQEILPLAIILKFLTGVRFIGDGSSVYIEEPEAHLFPSAQRKIVELISIVYNCASQPLQFFITTHSPYIITAFNNLLEAGRLNEILNKRKQTTLKRIVPPEQMLKSEEIKCYALSEGYCSNINCLEDGLISSDIIDNVSNELAIQFDKLLNLQ